MTARSFFGSRLGLLLALTLVPAVFAFVGCSQTCNIPTEQAPIVRIVNAMPNEPNVNIYLSNKALALAYPYVLPNNFGYAHVYSDGTNLHTGIRQSLVVLSTLMDTLIDTAIELNQHRHTLVVMGRGGDKSTARIMLFDDDVQASNPQENLIRYVDAIPDIPSMDVYYAPYPDTAVSLSLFYADSVGYENIGQPRGLTITKSGDTSDIIFSLPYSLNSTKGFFSTIILRGVSHPRGTEPTVESTVLGDVVGNFSFDIKSFYVRFINATRLVDTELSLMPHGPADAGGPRTNISGQNVLLSIPRDSASAFAPFNPYYDGDSASGRVTWFYGLPSQFSDTAFTVYHFDYKPDQNIRYSMIALDDAPLGSKPVFDSMILTDTLSYPSPGLTRLRLVNLSPDHPMSFKLNGTQFTMPFRDVQIVDVPAGIYSFTVTDANNASLNETITFTTPNGAPATLLFMPDTAPGKMPYRLAPE